MPTTLVVAASSVELWLKFLTTKTPLDPLPNFAIDPISTSLLITFMFGHNNRFHSCGCYTYTKWLNNSYFNMLFLSFNNCHFWHYWWNYAYSKLTMFHSAVTHWYPLWCRMWMWISFWFSIPGLNRWTNLSTLWSQLASQFHAFKYIWITRIHDYYFYGWSIIAPTTFYNSTCLIILTLIWKGTKGQSMITCLSSSRNAQTFESNMIIFESTYS